MKNIVSTHFFTFSATGSIEANVARRAGYEAYFAAIESYDAPSGKRSESDIQGHAIRAAQEAELKTFNETKLSTQVGSFVISYHSLSSEEREQLKCMFVDFMIFPTGAYRLRYKAWQSRMCGRKSNRIVLFCSQTWTCFK